MNKYKRQKMNKRNKKLAEEIKTVKDFEDRIYYLESLKLCTKSEVYKQQIENNIQNIKKWWESK